MRTRNFPELPFNCPKCETSHAFNKFGFGRRKDGTKTQRWQCKKCGSVFVLDGGRRNRIRKEVALKKLKRIMINFSTRNLERVLRGHRIKYRQQYRSAMPGWKGDKLVVEDFAGRLAATAGISKRTFHRWVRKGKLQLANEITDFIRERHPRARD